MAGLERNDCAVGVTNEGEQRKETISVIGVKNNVLGQVMGNEQDRDSNNESDRDAGLEKHLDRVSEGIPHQLHLQKRTRTVMEDADKSEKKEAKMKPNQNSNNVHNNKSVGGQRRVTLQNKPQGPPLPDSGVVAGRGSVVSRPDGHLESQSTRPCKRIRVMPSKVRNETKVKRGLPPQLEQSIRANSGNGTAAVKISNTVPTTGPAPKDALDADVPNHGKGFSVTLNDGDADAKMPGIRREQDGKSHGPVNLCNENRMKLKEPGGDHAEQSEREQAVNCTPTAVSKNKNHCNEPMALEGKRTDCSECEGEIGPTVALNHDVKDHDADDMECVDGGESTEVQGKHLGQPETEIAIIPKLTFEPDQIQGADEEAHANAAQNTTTGIEDKGTAELNVTTTNTNANTLKHVTEGNSPASNTQETRNIVDGTKVNVELKGFGDRTLKEAKNLAVEDDANDSTSLKASNELEETPHGLIEKVVNVLGNSDALHNTQTDAQVGIQGNEIVTAEGGLTVENDAVPSVARCNKYDTSGQNVSTAGKDSGDSEQTGDVHQKPQDDAIDTTGKIISVDAGGDLSDKTQIGLNNVKNVSIDVWNEAVGRGEEGSTKPESNTSLGELGEAVHNTGKVDVPIKDTGLAAGRNDTNSDDIDIVDHTARVGSSNGALDEVGVALKNSINDGTEEDSKVVEHDTAPVEETGEKIAEARAGELDKAGRTENRCLKSEGDVNMRGSEGEQIINQINGVAEVTNTIDGIHDKGTADVQIRKEFQGTDNGGERGHAKDSTVIGAKQVETPTGDVEMCDIAEGEETERNLGDEGGATDCIASAAIGGGSIDNVFSDGMNGIDGHRNEAESDVRYKKATVPDGSMGMVSDATAKNNLATACREAVIIETRVAEREVENTMDAVTARTDIETAVSEVETTSVPKSVDDKSTMLEAGAAHCVLTGAETDPEVATEGQNAVSTMQYGDSGRLKAHEDIRSPERIVDAIGSDREGSNMMGGERDISSSAKGIAKSVGDDRFKEDSGQAVTSVGEKGNEKGSIARMDLHMQSVKGSTEAGKVVSEQSEDTVRVANETEREPMETSQRRQRKESMGISNSDDSCSTRDGAADGTSPDENGSPKGESSPGIVAESAVMERNGTVRNERDASAEREIAQLRAELSATRGRLFSLRAVMSAHGLASNSQANGCGLSDMVCSGRGRLTVEMPTIPKRAQYVCKEQEASALIESEANERGKGENGKRPYNAGTSSKSALETALANVRTKVKSLKQATGDAAQARADLEKRVSEWRSDFQRQCQDVMQKDSDAVNAEQDVVDAVASLFSCRASLDDLRRLRAGNVVKRIGDACRTSHAIAATCDDVYNRWKQEVLQILQQHTASLDKMS